MINKRTGFYIFTILFFVGFFVGHKNANACSITHCYHQSYYEAYYEGSYYNQASYEGGYYAEGYYQGYYQSYYQGYYQGNYEGSYYSEGYYQSYYQGYYQGTYGGGPTPPPIPVITSIINSTCGKLIINWNDVSGETSYAVWRSAVSGSGYANISGNLAANIITYQDTPPAINTRYYYLVKATNAQGTATSTEENGFNLDCTASLATSNKSLIKVNGVAFGSSSVIHTNDTVTFQITIANSGPSNATINYICDTPSSNFINFRNLNIVGAGSVNGGVTQASASCNNYPRLNVSGTEGIGNWIVTYDTTFQSTGSGALELCSNNGAINANSGSGVKDTPVKYGPALCNKGSGAVPSFREINP